MVAAQSSSSNDRAKQSREPINEHLAFLMIGSFLLAFVGARIFTTLFPHAVVVVSGGIHFHHFWYGLVMVLVAGWLGIISIVPTHRRALSVVFGVGAGLIADELGLLLTLGNYYSSLTYTVVVGLLGFGVLILLIFRRPRSVWQEVVGTSLDESLLHWGILIAGLSALPFSFGSYDQGFLALALGIGIAVAGYVTSRQRRVQSAKGEGNKRIRTHATAGEHRLRSTTTD